MNTPAHVVLSGLVLGRGRSAEGWAPITAGAIAPDLPMFGFYLTERLGRGAPEQLIWSQLYFEPNWQLFFDVWNSLPLILVAGLVAFRLGSSTWLLFFASMGLHCLFDLPLHHDDAHRHFLPFSDWRFASPISYWDPERYGLIVAPLELLLVLAGSVVFLRYRPRPWRIVGAVCLATTGLLVVFALLFWLGMGPVTSG